MNKVVYFADATCDLPVELIKQHNVQIIGLRYNIGDEDGWFTTANQKQLDDYYGKMRKGETASTSLVLYDDATEAFEPFFKEGYDIIHLGLSSGLARTWENANNAGNTLAEKYGRKFYAPDTKCVTAMHVPILKHLVGLVEKYKSDSDGFEKIIKEFPDFYNRIKGYFTVEDLKYLHKSGRLSGASKTIGGILNLKPIIKVDEDGKLNSFAKKTGRLQSIQFLASQVSKIDPDYPEIYILHADCPNDAKLLEQKVQEHVIDATTVIIPMGFIICAHTGPGTLGLGFVSK